jgi:hypothetical protein
MAAFSSTLSHATTHVTRSRGLWDELSALLDESASLIRRSRDLCLAYRRIAGGSDPDSPAIVEIIGKTPMCVDCLSRKIGIVPARAAEAVERVRAFLQVTVKNGRCEGCLNFTTVYGLTNGVPAPSAPVRQNDVIWAFLEAHRGKMHCTQCIANALASTRRIDRAILAAEGRGARRQYGSCAVCGRERLLCGLTR